MKATLFSRVPYTDPAAGRLAGVIRDLLGRIGRAVDEGELEQFELADELGFDWITLAEHHYAPLSLTPNPMVMAGALTQRVRHARIALLGAIIPSLNPVRVAEEFAMLDVLTGGRLVAGMLGARDRVRHLRHQPGRVARAVRGGAAADPARLDRAAAVRLARKILRVPQHLDLATAGPQPYPPIYMSGSSRRRASWRRATGWDSGSPTPIPLARQAVRHYREQATQQAGSPGPTRCSTAYRSIWPTPTRKPSRRSGAGAAAMTGSYTTGAGRSKQRWRAPATTGATCRSSGPARDEAPSGAHRAREAPGRRSRHGPRAASLDP